MTKYHINPQTGTPNICSATKRQCSFGGNEEHYSSKEDARKAFELKNKKIEFKTNPLKGFSVERIFAVLERSADKELALHAIEELKKEKNNLIETIVKATTNFLEDKDTDILRETMSSLEPRQWAIRRTEERIANIFQTGYAGDDNVWADTKIEPISREEALEQFSKARVSILLSYERNWNGVMIPNYDSKFLLTGAVRVPEVDGEMISFFTEGKFPKVTSKVLCNKTFIDNKGNIIIEDDPKDGQTTHRLVYRLFD